MDILKREHPLVGAMNMVKRANPFKNLVLEEGFITEGSSKIRAPKGVVFYNPVQQFNRDLSVSVISTFQKQYLDDPKLQKRFPVQPPSPSLLFINISY